jgi:hypothetical protein
MATYRFQIKKHVRDDMYNNESVEIELSESEYRSIKSDDSKYSKGSTLLSSKLGGNVQSLGFPTEVKNSKGKEKAKGQTTKKSSLFKPLWQLPFKLFWRGIKYFAQMMLSS